MRLGQGAAAGLCLVAGVTWSDEYGPGPSAELSVWFNKRMGKRFVRHSRLRPPQQFTGVLMGARWCSQPARPGHQEKSHKTDFFVICQFREKENKWQVDTFSVLLFRKWTFSLVEWLKAGACHGFLAELSSGLPKAEYLNYLYCQAWIGIKHGIRLFCSCAG